MQLQGRSDGCALPFASYSYKIWEIKVTATGAGSGEDIFFFMLLQLAV